MMAAKTILMVDDEGILLLSLKQSLRLRFGASYRYETAMSAKEGLERIEALAAAGEEVGLVISDWLMPGMKGDEFLVRVRASHPGIRLVMLTGHADEADMARLASAVRLDAFMRKPWEPELLFDVVEKALNS
jgi:CheY-like chemotaxis protein